MDPLTQQIFSSHTQALNDHHASLLAVLEVLVHNDLVDEESFTNTKAKYLARIDQAAEENRRRAEAETRIGDTGPDEGN